MLCKKQVYTLFCLFMVSALAAQTKDTITTKNNQYQAPRYFPHMCTGCPPKDKQPPKTHLESPYQFKTDKPVPLIMDGDSIQDLLKQPMKKEKSPVI